MCTDHDLGEQGEERALKLLAELERRGLSSKAARRLAGLTLAHTMMSLTDVYRQARLDLAIEYVGLPPCDAEVITTPDGNHHIAGAIPIVEGETRTNAELEALMNRAAEVYRANGHPTADQAELIVRLCAEMAGREIDALLTELRARTRDEKEAPDGDEAAGPAAEEARDQDGSPVEVR